MNTRFKTGYFASGAARFLGLLWLFRLTLVADAANSFVVGFQGVDVVDTAVDSAGVTYVLGKDANNHAVLRKYDASGAVLLWTGDLAVYRTNTTLRPTAFCVAAGAVTSTNQLASTTNQLFVVGQNGANQFRIVRLNTDTGTTNGELTGTTTVYPKSVTFTSGSVYVCGNYTSTAVDTNIFGRTANPRGSQAAIIVRLDPNLPATNAALSLTTFGGAGGGNTAESVAVDETGDVYVSGSFASGVFNLDGSIAANGLWRVDVVHSSGGIGDIGTAENVLTGSTATSTNTAFYSTINFGSGSDGNFGNDATFPGGNGDHFVTHATGSIWIQNAGNYIFRSTTDDGTRVRVDGSVVAEYTGLRGTGSTDSSPISLARGLHTVDYIQFENEGDQSAELAFKPDDGVSAFSLLTPSKIRDTQNKGYVAKFSGDFSSLEEVYSSASEGPGNGGAFHEIQYVQGWIYAVGYWKGRANNPALGLPDDSVNASSDIDIVKLDTGLTLKGRATVKGVADNEGYSITSDEGGNVYFTGSYGPASVDFVGNGDRSPSDPSQDRRFTSLSAPSGSLFVAKLDSNMDYLWVDHPIGALPDSFSNVSKTRWNPVLQRVFWTGTFAAPTGTLTLGQPTSPVTLNGSQGFLTVVDPDGTFTEQVFLTIISDFGVSGSQVLPFGGPLLGTNTTTTNRQALIKGAQLTASVPAAIYRQGTNDVDSDQNADTRIRSTGYSVDDNVPTGGSSSYTFVISKDTIVKFNWTVDFALVIDSDLSGTVGSGDPDHGITGIAGLTSLASGNPDPAVQKHWVPKNENVIATIDSEVMDLNHPGLPVKYVVTGYDAFGPPNTQDATQTNFFAFVGNEVRRQIPPPPFNGFTLSGPAFIRYHWKLKLGVRMDTTGPTSSTYPYVKVVRDPGATNSTVTQSDGIGVGVYFYDEHTSLEIGTVRNQGVVQLKGWFNGDGFVFASSGTLADLTSSFQISGTNYASKSVADLVRPAQVMWDYGDRIFEETVYIGNSVTFSTVDDPAVSAILRKDQPPERADVNDGPANSTGGDMAVWDPVGKKYYPLRPGTILSYWLTTGDPAARVIIRLIFKYPVSPHYRHIANTPPVNLEPVTNDLVSFNSLKYTEPTTGAAVDNNALFTATGPGKTVLLFYETSGSGRGGAIQSYRVRVVETKLWDAQLPAVQTAVIGQKITSAYDTAGLGTGFTMFTNARYNPFIYDPQHVQGPIIPVNLNPSAAPNERLVVAWYEQRDKILWPYQAVRYEPAWPTPETGLDRIVIASRFGSESVAADGTDQVITPEETIGTNVIPAETTFNPVRFQQVQIYNQPISTNAGYNPNEEHALMAPSLRSVAVSPRPMAAYALRDGDLNVTNRDATYTSDPYVLVQFLDTLHSEFKMKVFSIIRATNNLNAGALSYDYKFQDEMLAGEPVIPFYPLVEVIGATPCPGTYGRDGQPAIQRCFWKDHKGTGWAVSGDSFFDQYFYYPLTPDFWWPPSDPKLPGDCVAWLPVQPAFSKGFFDIDYTRTDQVPAAQPVRYTTTWPQNLPVLKVGETLTFPGGEYSLDNPTTTVTTDQGIEIQDTPGLPGVVGWASGEVIFDSLNPVMDDQKIFDNYTVVLYQGLEQRTVSLPVANFPDLLLPANNRTEVKDGKYVFLQAPSSLQRRLFYDPLTGELGIKGLLNDKTLGDSTLTASPPAVYVLEPNVLTTAEKQILDGTAPGSPYADLAGSSFAQAVDALYDFCRNPNALDKGSDGHPDQAYRLGLEQEIIHQINGQPVLQTNNAIVTPARDPSKGAPLVGLGPGLAVVANPAFLRPSNTVSVSYVTMAENNSDSLGGSPVVLHIIKVDRTQRYRGSIKTILSDNVFDENIVLRHTGDFGGNADELVFEWWYRPEDGTTANTPDRATTPNPWKVFADQSGNQGKGFYQITLKGNPSAPEALIGDTLFFLRYRHKDEIVDGVNWEVPQVNQALGGEQHCVLNNCVPGIPYEWAGAGNSTPRDLNQDGLPDYVPQLAEGWVKRVLTRVNPYEARINDFSADNPADYTSIIRELGARFEGPVALNPDKNVIENVGLIALYQTILDRAEALSIDLSTPISTPAIANALELASTRLSDFYTLLGNEAYADSLNPTIGFGSDSVAYGSLAPSIFAFQNQVSSLLEQELALLRGLDAFNGPPVYNRLFWNFTKGEGEVAYAMKYDISDVNNDGIIDVNDAMILYPQGHGDAWGHYLTATKMQYDLLRQPNFNWVSRSEFLNINDIVIPVDYLDERKFAEVAGAKAKAGADIVNLTYREKYVADPNGQWQGYTDTDVNRAWGVEEWARRAGQGAFFDWVTANALLPAVHPNTNYTGIQKVDRTTVQDIALVAANLVAIQATMNQANHGNNPLGLVKGALAFDLDPTQATTHFDQIYARAVTALKNAKAAFDNANQLNNMIRQIANAEQTFATATFQQDLSYRNQLIQIYGTPYSGQIGSGKAFPAGYQGPDTMLYMYVDVNKVNNETVPQPPAYYYSNITDIAAGSDAVYLHGQELVGGVDNTFLQRFHSTFSDFTFTTATGLSNSVNYTDFTNPTGDPSRNILVNLNLPIQASGYTFVAPSDWGQRLTTGDLQNIIIQMLQAEADVDVAIGTWDASRNSLINALKLLNAKYANYAYVRDLTAGQNAFDDTLGAVSLGFKIAAAVAEFGSGVAKDISTAAKDAIPRVTPTAGFAVSLGDALSFLVAAADFTGISLEVVLNGVKLALTQASGTTDFLQKVGDAIFALEKENQAQNWDILQNLYSIQNQANDEALKRLAVFKAIQVLTGLSDSYRSKVAQGVRLVEERTAFNKRVAAQTQQRRYQDMTFRVSRNDALQKYRAAFDLASRYAYLAGEAYDFDTNLGENDAGSPVNVLASIVRDQTIGLFTDGPNVGAGGLAEDLAMLKANYDVLKNRMGLNNPQIETTLFSLRTEAFRIPQGTNSDALWSNTLSSAAIYKPDLWQVAEFRRFCRPFSSVTNGPEPGLVIPFSSQIVPNENYFGWPLGGHDNSYDPSVYSTRIASAAVYFGNYDIINLPQTPRVYLIPVGQDIVTIPNSADLGVRVWNVVDETIPLPFPSISDNLSDPNWQPLTDSLNGNFGQARAFSSFRASGFDHDPITSSELSALVFDARLVGRSAWNTSWLLIIPGATLNANPTQGLSLFINSVKDIKLVLKTYGYRGN
jgi:hypothetical protein